MNETIEETIVVAPNLEVTAVYTHLGPFEAPDSGSEWASDLDYSKVSVKLFLPTNKVGGSSLAPWLLSEDTAVFGAELSDDWGTYESGYRVKTIVRYEARIVEAYHACRSEVLSAVDTLKSVIDRRNARLNQRLATLQAARENSPFKHTD